MNYASSQLGKPHVLDYIFYIRIEVNFNLFFFFFSKKSLRETYSGITQMSFIEKLTSEQLPIIISNLQVIYFFIYFFLFVFLIPNNLFFVELENWRNFKK